jgi:hypothetical protein
MRIFTDYYINFGRHFVIISDKGDSLGSVKNIYYWNSFQLNLPYNSLFSPPSLSLWVTSQQRAQQLAAVLELAKNK